MWDYYTKFMETVKNSPAVVLVGETGSGKTTQVRTREGGRVGVALERFKCPPRCPPLLR